jgi:hypothetical protein
MSTYYYKGSKILAPLQITTNEPVFATDSVSLKQLRASQGAQRWEMTFSVLTNDNAADILLGAIDEIATANTMVMPQLKEVDDRATQTASTAPVSVAAVGGDTSVSVSKASISGTLPRGGFVKFSNHDKVYIVKQDVNFSGTGSAVVEVYPPLNTALTISDQLVMGSSVNFTYFRSVDNISGITYQDGILAEAGAITLIEAV